MKIVLIQPDTLIGDALENLIPRETNAQLCRIKIGASSATNDDLEYTLDFSDRKLLRKTILSEKPDVIINSHLITNSKDNPTKEQIWNVNVDLNDFLITTAKIAEVHYITFSSELVFDGKRGPYSEDDLASPTDYISKSLLARENSCKQDLNLITLFRTTKVFGYSSYDNLDEVSEIYVYLQTGIDVEVKNTVISNPVWNNDVARAVINACERKKYGLYNLGGADFLNEVYKVRLISKVFGFNDVDINAEDAPEIKKLGLVNLKAQTDLRIDFTKYESALQVMKYYMDTNFRIMSI